MKQNHKTVSPMSNERRNTYVKEQITNALLKLLYEKPIEDISISELCECAGIGRASFYRNFMRKEDILQIYISHIFREELQVQEGEPLHKSILKIFTHLKKNKTFYQLLYQRKLIFLLKDIMSEIYGLKTDSSAIEAYSSAFVIYSLYGWIEVWLQRGAKESAEELATLFKMRGL